MRHPNDSHPRSADDSTDDLPSVPAALDLALWLTRNGGVEPAPRPDRPRSGGGPSSAPATIASRAAAYLNKLPPAVSGQKGHDRAFHTACVLVKGFGLSVEQARPLFEDWNQTCVPPWSAGELEHKLKSADTTADDRPRGYLANQDRAPRRSGPKARGVRAAAPALAPGCDSAIADALLAYEGEETNPHRLALLFLKLRHAHPGGVTLRFWRDEFYAWGGGCYRIVDGPELRAQLSQFLADEFRRIHRLSSAEADDRARKRRSSGPIPVSRRLVGDVLQALTGLVLIPSTSCNAQPSWIDATPEAVAPTPVGRSRRRPTTMHRGRSPIRPAISSNGPPPS